MKLEEIFVMKSGYSQYDTHRYIHCLETYTHKAEALANILGRIGLQHALKSIAHWQAISDLTEEEPSAVQPHL